MDILTFVLSALVLGILAIFGISAWNKTRAENARFDALRRRCEEASTRSEEARSRVDTIRADFEHLRYLGEQLRYDSEKRRIDLEEERQRRSLRKETAKPSADNGAVG